MDSRDKFGLNSLISKPKPQRNFEFEAQGEFELNRTKRDHLFSKFRFFSTINLGYLFKI